MPRPKNYHQVPKPSSAVAARNRLEAGALDEKILSRLWRPRAGSLLEVVLATISRVSLRLIDRNTGEAYSADELETKILALATLGTVSPAYLPDDWNPLQGLPGMLAGASHLTDAQWASGAKMVATAFPSLNITTSTGYAVMLKCDGTFGLVGLSGDPSDIGYPASPYDTTMPKLMVAFPCDVDGNITGFITQLSCAGGGVIALDVRGCTGLEVLSCSFSALRSLDLSKNTLLYYLNCNTNMLPTLDVSGLTSLVELHCDDNLLTVLDISANPDLLVLNCYNNYLTVSAVNDILVDLLAAGADSGEADLSGGSSAAPTGAGAAAALTLTTPPPAGKGWGITTN